MPNQLPCVSTGRLPEPGLVRRLLDEAHQLFLPCNEGSNADYIPALALVPSDLFGICLAGVSGQCYAVGDTEVPFTIQSLSKPFVFGLVCQAIGEEEARRRGFKIGLFLQPVMGGDAKPYSEAERPMLLSEPELARRAAFYADARVMFQALAQGYAGQADVCVGYLSQVFSNVVDTFYADSGHLNGRGNERVARALVEQLRAGGLVPPPP